MNDQKKEQTVHVIQQANAYELDSIKRSTDYVFWGTSGTGEKDKDGNPVFTIEATKKAYGEKERDAEQKRRTRRLVFNFKGVTIDQLLSREVSSTTAYKQWYNNESVAKMTEAEVEKLLKDNPKEIEISVKDLFENSGRKPADPAKGLLNNVAKLKAQGLTPEQIFELIQNA